MKKQYIVLAVISIIIIVYVIYVFGGNHPIENTHLISG